jgi:FMN-dependent NADH-azoreductase
MAKLLHIISSPRGDRSTSIAVAKTFLDAYAAKNPGDTIETLDLWKTTLPEFNGEAIKAKYAVMSGEKFTPEEDAAWKVIVKINDHFKSFDKYVVSLPMWNFGIPYKLKHYIDVLAQPGLAFSFSPGAGYTGLITGKPLVAVHSRGGVYAPGTPAEGYDLQSKYLRLVLSFIGFTDIRDIFLESTASAKGDALAKGNEQAKEIAAAF